MRGESGRAEDGKRAIIYFYHRTGSSSDFIPECVKRRVEEFGVKKVITVEKITGSMLPERITFDIIGEKVLEIDSGILKRKVLRLIDEWRIYI